MLVRALVDHYDSLHCYRTRGQVFNYDGPMHQHIAPMPAEGAPALAPAPTPARVPLDVQEQLAKLVGSQTAQEAQTVPPAPGPEPVPFMSPTPVKGAVPQLPSGVLPDGVVPSPELAPLPASMPLPESMPLPSTPLTPADDGRDMLG